MSPPLAVTEDTPPDMLAGAMDLLAVLPNGHNIKMSVERSTPMMDLLIQITTANKISPGGHAIRAYGDRGILPYQPSTPIGALDAWSIHIVPKKSSASTNAKNQPPFQPVNHNTPFEQTFRLQVNLPRNQLYVSRVSYTTRLEQVFRQVCEEKNLDPSKYCLVHPANLDEELNLNSTFLECKLQKVTLVLRSNRPQVGLSSVDIMALKRLDNSNQRCGNKYYASHSYDGSVSSGSLEGRSMSPVRSDESSTSPTTSQTNAPSNKPFRKRRPAPKPPTAQNGRDSNNGCDSLTVLHSRNSSDSSGYHESSVLSESPNSNSLAESLPRRSKLPNNTDSNNVCQRLSSNAKCSSKIGNNLSRSLSNLATDVDDRRQCPKNFPSNGMKPKQYSASSTSLSTIPGKRKKAPAPPPPPSSSSTKSLLSLKEEETPSPCSGGISSTDIENANNDAALSSGAEDVVDAPIARNAAPPPPQTCSSPSSVDSRRCSESRTPNVDLTASQYLCTDHLPVGAKDKELIMDDDEIDRIFRDATKGYESAPSSAISSPPESVDNNVESRRDEICEEDLESWQYTIPSPPKGFRDQTDSPQVTEFDSVTSTNVGVTFNEEPRLKEELISPIIPQPEKSEFFVDRRGQTTIESVPAATSKWESKYQSSTHDSGLGSDDSIPSVHESKTNTAFREVKPTTIERRASTLQNFTISTYQSSKPTDIFRDESVKTWQTTELAKSSRPFVSKDVSVEKSSSGNNLGRHCSFNAIDRTPSSQIRRSKSHISLLSGNFAKFNQFGKLDVKLEDANDESNTLAKVDLWKQNKLRSQSLPSTNSSLIRMGDDPCEMLTRDTDKDEEEVLEQSNRIRFSRQPEEKFDVCHDKSGSQLQSLQILRNILPQIDKTQNQSDQSASSLEPCENFFGREHRSIESKIKSFNEQSTSVNLQSWNERPRRQVSIKTDRDYVFGGSVQSCVTNNHVNDQSRVPVVTAVEFKKPFTPPARVTVNENDHPKRKSSTIVMVSEQKPSVVFSSQESNVSSSTSRLWSADSNGTAHGDYDKSGRISSFTFKEYKNKLASKEKSSPKKEFDGCSNTNPTAVNVDRCSRNSDYDIKLIRSDKNSICNNDEYRDCSQTVDSVKNRQMSRGSSFVPMPPVPPPFLKPTLKPVNRDFSAKRPCSVTNLDPRDVLLSSIKNFDRDRLRKLRVK